MDTATLLTRLAAAATLQLDDWRDQAVLAYLAGTGERFIKVGGDDAPLPAAATLDGSTWCATFDSATHTTWAIQSSEKRLDNEGEAEAYVAGLALCGKTDWRVPQIDELEALRTLDSDPCVPPADYFPGVKAAWHWSSSPVPGYPDFARVVSFGYGLSSFDHRSGGFLVLACRGGVAPAGVSPGQ